MNPMHDVLHGIAVKKHVDISTIAALTGIDASAVDALLERAIATGRVAETHGKFLLTSAGRMILEGQYSRYCADARADTALVDAYDRFELINADLKQIITDWQTVEIGGQKVANDHADAAYNEKIIDRLNIVHERMEGIFTLFVDASSRFAYYADKLEAALVKAEDGAHEWVSDAKIESYHTVWFEMHEDLLRMLDRQRDE